VSRTGFHGRTKEVRNNNEQDRGENQVQKSQFLAERGAVPLERRFGGTVQVEVAVVKLPDACPGRILVDTLKN